MPSHTQMYFLSKENSRKERADSDNIGRVLAFPYFPFILSHVEIFQSWCFKLSGSNVYEFPHSHHLYRLQKKSPSKVHAYTHVVDTSRPHSLLLCCPGMQTDWVVTFSCEQQALQRACQPIWVVCSDLKKSLEGCSRGDRLWRGARRPTSKKGSLLKEPGVVFKEDRLISLMSGDET